MRSNGSRGDQKGTKIGIIQTLRINGSVSRIELTRLTNLSRATISLAIAELIDSGFVQETDSRHSTGGRPATLLELTPHSHAMIGADYSDQKLTLGAFDLLGNVIDHQVFTVASNQPGEIIRTIAEQFEPFVRQLDAKPIELLGIGLPGLIDTHRGSIMTVTAPNYPDWADVNIADEIRKKIGWPVIALNRHRARGLAECRFGAGKEFNELVYIGVGSGIAAGIFNNRELMYGALGGAGEIGHVTMEPNGPLCTCGNHGCLQEYSTGNSMERDIRVLLRSGRYSAINPDNSNHLLNTHTERILKSAEEGDPLCTEVVEKAAGYLGIAMANLVNTMNPEAIILGGEVPRNSNLYVATAKQAMHQRAMGPLVANVAVKVAAFNEIGGALGAANFALDRNLDYSLFVHSAD